jgi:hypothetical protein
MKLNTFFAFAFLSLPLAQVACSADASDPSANTSEDITAKHAGDEGGFCGGFAGIACKAGLACKLSSSHPDASGTCQKEICGGFAGLTCKPGFSCQLSGHHPDAAGTCEKDSAEGEVCGDDVAIQKKCAAGLTCVFAAGGPISEHQAGKCEKVAPITGEWGADSAIMSIGENGARIEFGCATAAIDALVPTTATTFTGTGTHTAGTGIAFPPGMGPKPQAATFSATVSGRKMTLVMTVGDETTELQFTKGRHIDLAHCL